MAHSSPHRIFETIAKTVWTDGTPVSLLALRHLGATSVCQICGEPIACPFWPPREREEWRHVTTPGAPS